MSAAQQRALDRALSAWRSFCRPGNTDDRPLPKCHAVTLQKFLAAARCHAECSPTAKTFTYHGRRFWLQRADGWLTLVDNLGNPVAGPVRLDGGAAWEA